MENGARALTTTELASAEAAIAAREEEERGDLEALLHERATAAQAVPSFQSCERTHRTHVECGKNEKRNDGTMVFAGGFGCTRSGVGLKVVAEPWWMAQPGECIPRNEAKPDRRGDLCNEGDVPRGKAANGNGRTTTSEARQPRALERKKESHAEINNLVIDESQFNVAWAVLMEMYANHGDRIAQQYGGSGAMHKITLATPSSGSSSVATLTKGPAQGGLRSRAKGESTPTTSSKVPKDNALSRSSSPIKPKPLSSPLSLSRRSPNLQQRAEHHGSPGAFSPEAGRRCHTTPSSPTMATSPAIEPLTLGRPHPAGKTTTAGMASPVSKTPPRSSAAMAVKAEARGKFREGDHGILRNSTLRERRRLWKAMGGSLTPITCTLNEERIKSGKVGVESNPPEMAAPRLQDGTSQTSATDAFEGVTASGDDPTAPLPSFATATTETGGVDGVNGTPSSTSSSPNAPRAALTGGLSNALVAAGRYYSNYFSDADRQLTMNLVLGVIVPYIKDPLERERRLRQRQAQTQRWQRQRHGGRSPLPWELTDLANKADWAPRKERMRRAAAANAAANAAAAAADAVLEQRGMLHALQSSAQGQELEDSADIVAATQSLRAAEKVAEAAACAAAEAAMVCVVQKWAMSSFLLLSFSVLTFFNM